MTTTSNQQQTVSTVDANTYTPKFLPDNSVTVSVMGYARGIRSQGYCLDQADVPNLLTALRSLGYSVDSYLDAPWLGQTGSFSQPVPWLAFANGADINAGQIANYFAHGAAPFVGSYYAQALAADINSRSSS